MLLGFVVVVLLLLTLVINDLNYIHKKKTDTKVCFKKKDHLNRVQIFETKGTHGKNDQIVLLRSTVLVLTPPMLLVVSIQR